MACFSSSESIIDERLFFEQLPSGGSWRSRSAYSSSTSNTTSTLLSGVNVTARTEPTSMPAMRTGDSGLSPPPSENTVLY